MDQKGTFIAGGSERRNDHLDCSDHLRHALEVVPSYEDGRRRKQMRALLRDQRILTGSLDIRFKLTLQLIGVQGDAKAVAVE